MSEASQAVFLSYASQDAQAAQRICQALRSAGIEVWFDRSELRGGDAWDQSIRRQIKTCALFIPVVSHSTHERAEGYFRLEWKLAVDRSDLITADKAFLVPVVIDDTRDDEERVPEKFREVQWTRLPAGETPPEFTRRVQNLLAGQPAPPPAAPRTRAALAARRPAPASIAAVAVVLAAAAVYLFSEKPWVARSAAFAPPPHSVAVLPFVNMSGDKEQDYFSDGLTEELLNSLARVDELQVAARTSSFSFKGTGADIGTIARKLNVGAILEGSVRRSGNTVRISAQLINAVSGFHMWTQTYDRNLGDVLVVQADIANAAATALKVSLLGNAAAKIELGGTRNPAAFDAFLRSRKLSRFASTVKDYQAAVAELDEAIRLDPTYALAYAWRSLMYSDYNAIEAQTPDREVFGKEEADAREAIRLAPELAEGYAALGRFFEIGGLDFTQAREAYARALALAPGNVSVLQMSSLFEGPMGRFDEAIAAARRAVTLDPLNGSSYQVLGFALSDARRYQEANLAFSQAISLDPEYPESYIIRGFAYYFLGDIESARSACEPRADNWLAQQCLAMVYDKLGRRADARSMLAKLKALKGADGAYHYASIYAQWGEKAQALEWLEVALRARDPNLHSLKTDPQMDPLRSEPRFQAVMKEAARELRLPSDT